MFILPRLSLVLILTVASNVSAQVFFPLPQTFVLDKSCEASDSLKKRTAPQTLQAGERVQVLGENRPQQPSHAYVQVGSARKWLALECGHYETNMRPNVPPANTLPQTACLPFFDQTTNPVRIKDGTMVDMTPPPPVLDAFGLGINRICGAAGQRVEPQAFQQLLRSHPAVLQRLYHFTQGKVFAERPAAADTDAYLQDLTAAWFNVRAFEHIFCGEPEANGPIGGLHYVGRYWQLQQTGEACRMDNLRQNEAVEGVLYSMGVTMRTRDGVARSSIKGYGLTLNAQDILLAGTRAFAENPTSSRQSQACLLPIKDNDKAFTAVFVRRPQGIRTFYPDATPSARDPQCQQAIELPQR